jgi:polysaccharide biosynthesis protein PelF
MTRPRVLLTTEGTYPFQRGGVSTWCHELTESLRNVDFKIFAVIANPYLPQQYKCSSNVTEIIKIPLWGVEDPVEFSWRFPFVRAVQSKSATTKAVIAHKFLPVFQEFLHGVVNDSHSTRRMGKLLVAMHDYFLQYDYAQTMNSVLVWESFQDIVLQPWQDRCKLGLITVGEMTEALRFLHRFLMPIHVPVPDVDLVHSSAASFCGLPGVIGKIKHGLPYLLTEHGIIVRENYLRLVQTIDSLFVRLFLNRLVGAVVRLNYCFADIIAPVCEYNTRWEKWWGVPANKIKVIYNGADPEIFKPVPRGEPTHPQVMNMGLIFPLKGQLELIKAAAIVRDKIPNVEFQLYGKPSDEAYFRSCQAAVTSFRLENNVNFAGFTNEPWRAYSNADVVAMSSISEGFPYAVVEAMLSGGTIVATDVGGVGEALGETGMLVPAKQPPALAAGILHMLTLPTADRHKFGEQARARALELFTKRLFAQTHIDVYDQLIRQMRIDLLTNQPTAIAAGQVTERPALLGKNS